MCCCRRPGASHRTASPASQWEWAGRTGRPISFRHFPSRAIPLRPTSGTNGRRPPQLTGAYDLVLNFKASAPLGDGAASNLSGHGSLGGLRYNSIAAVRELAHSDDTIAQSGCVDAHRVIQQSADHLRAAARPDGQHEPAAVAAGLSAAEQRVRAVARATGVSPVAGIQRIPGAHQSSATAAPPAPGAARRMLPPGGGQPHRAVAPRPCLHDRRRGIRCRPGKRGGRRQTRRRGSGARSTRGSGAPLPGRSAARASTTTGCSRSGNTIAASWRTCSAAWRSCSKPAATIPRPSATPNGWWHWIRWPRRTTRC